MTEQLNEEEIREHRRSERLQKMKHQKELQIQRRMLLKKTAPPVLVVCVLIIAVVSMWPRKSENSNIDQESPQLVEAGQTESAVKQNEAQQSQRESGSVDMMRNAISTVLSSQVTQKVYYAEETENTKAFNGEVISNYGVFIDIESNTVLAQRNGKNRISPASMTKVLTVLVAAEHIKNLDDTFTMTLDITDYSFVNDCSNVGFLEGEEVTVRDLFYGTILPSGADAAVGLATYVAGSQENFVELMNKKLEELGLSDTAHMTNCVGIYDENHYCTPYDMAMIMEAAIDNELCREIMNTRTYTTSATEQHPEGITVSNWFMRRIEDKDTGGEIICGKTGYVVESGSCAVSYGKDYNGKEYVCVTADANSSWRCIYDHVALYSQFSTAKEDDANDTEGSGNAA